jgi:hypothetical protein
MSHDSTPSEPTSATEPQPGPSGHPDPTAQKDRRARYTYAICDAAEIHANLADAVMAIADAEQADLKAEIEALDEEAHREWAAADRYARERDEARATIERVKALADMFDRLTTKRWLAARIRDTLDAP